MSCPFAGHPERLLEHDSALLRKLHGVLAALLGANCDADSAEARPRQQLLNLLHAAAGSPRPHLDRPGLLRAAVAQAHVLGAVAVRQRGRADGPRAALRRLQLKPPP